MEQNKKKILLALTALVIIVGVGALLINTGIISVNVQAPKAVTSVKIGDEKSYAEDIAELQTIPQNFGAVTEFFVNLAKTDGGVYAYEVLKRAPLPPDTDLHLLGHSVGDELYKQQGLEGMQYCTPEFRNACSHSIVVGALLEDGLSVLDRVNDVCKKAPGGPGAYTMCFHGLGHGVLAFTEFEFPDAIELCKRVGTPEFNNNEFHQCVGGMVMEMNQGIHDQELWATKKDKYLDPEDPLKLCHSDFMPEEAKYFCYTYITPYMFDSAGAVNGNPTPEVFAKAFPYCEAVENDEWRRVCYAGFGKEMIVLAQSRDIRAMDQMTDAQFQKVIGWCQLAKVQEGIEACLLEVQNSLYWGGENDYRTSVNYCSLMPNADLKSTCFDHMFSNVSFYERSPQKKEEICAAVPSEYAETCKTTVSSN